MTSRRQLLQLMGAGLVAGTSTRAFPQQAEHARLPRNDPPEAAGAPVSPQGYLPVRTLNGCTLL